MDLWNMFKVPLSLELIEEYSIVCITRKVVVVFFTTMFYASLSFSEIMYVFLFTQHCYVSYTQSLIFANIAPKKTCAATVGVTTVGGSLRPCIEGGE
jgi:hypothetical protein